MSEAKLRAQRRREAREAAPDPRIKYTYLNAPIPAALVEQINMRFAFLAGSFEDRNAFIEALLQAGIDVCDQDVNAVMKYRAGEAKPVDPNAEPKEEKLVLSPDEVPAEARKVLAAVSPVGAAGYVGRRTGQ